MSFFGKKTGPAKMKSMKVELKAEKGQAKSSKKKVKAAKPMDFAAWVEHYVQMSKGNPV